MSARLPLFKLRTPAAHAASPAPVRTHDLLERLLWGLLAVASVAIVAVVLHGDPGWVDPLVSEEGPLEWGAAIGWLLLAPLVLWCGGTGRRALALAGVCLLFAAREFDLHKMVAGTSFLKINFYRGNAVAAHDKLIGAAVALAVLSVVLYGLGAGTLAFLRGRHWRRPWGRLVVLAFAMLVLAKLLDRTPAILKDEWHRPLDWTASHLVTVHEEWLECFAPLCLMAAALRRGRARQAVVRAT
jgi:hypothetical protein